MPTQVHEYLVFIASPSGCDEERAQVRAAVEQVNAAFSQHSLIFRSTGWETTTPAIGRAQGRINPRVEECDFFVGILANQWGSPSGEESSGFYEEFKLALKRNESSHDGTPHIALHFRTPPPEMLRDPGTDLAQVLKFKQDIRENFTAMWSQHDNGDEFGKNILAGLMEFGLDRLNVGAVSQSSQNDDREPSPVTPTDEPLDEARTQLKALALGAADVFAGVATGWYDRDRLLLMAKAFAVDDELLPEHLSNRIYSRHDDYQLSQGESRTVLRTLLADINTDGSFTGRVIPGWAHLRHPAGGKLGPEGANNLADLTDDDTSIARGALFVLLTESARPTRLWPRAGTKKPPTRHKRAWLAALRSAGPDAIARYAGTIIEPGDSEFLKRLADDTDLVKYADVLRALSELALGNRVPIARYGLQSAVIHRNWYLPHISATLADLDVADLVVLVGKSWTPLPLKITALRVLADRGGFTREFVQKLLKDDEGLWDTFFELVTTHQAISQLVLSIIQGEGPSPKPAAKDRLKAELVGNAQFEDLSYDDIDYAVKWDGIARRDPPAALEEARRVLTNGAEVYRRHLETLPLAETHPRLLVYLPDELREAALAALERNPSPTDARLFAEHLNGPTSSRRTHRAAANGFLKTATFQGLDELEALRSIESFWIDPDVITERMKSAGDAYVRAMVSMELPGIRAQAIETLASRRLLDEAELIDLLYDDDDHSRVAAARSLARRHTAEELQKILQEYRNANRVHWYNVVSLLDQAAFGPPGMREQAKI